MGSEDDEGGLRPGAIAPAPTIQMGPDARAPHASSIRTGNALQLGLAGRDQSAEFTQSFNRSNAALREFPESFRT